MTQLTHTSDRRAINVAKTLVGLAILTAVTAAVAGIVLLIASPETGSSLESALGLTAAVAGLGTAVLAIAALIYAQIKNLWRYAPSWVRVAAWLLIIAAAVMSIARSIVEAN